jgi:hypothetical protein
VVFVSRDEAPFIDAASGAIGAININNESKQALNTLDEAAGQIPITWFIDLRW